MIEGINIQLDRFDPKRVIKDKEKRYQDCLDVFFPLGFPTDAMGLARVIGIWRLIDVYRAGPDGKKSGPWMACLGRSSRQQKGSMTLRIPLEKLKGWPCGLNVLLRMGLPDTESISVTQLQNDKPEPPPHPSVILN